MKIGVDFDNTIVCYDPLFHALALERGWITPDVEVAKNAVRNAMWKADRRTEWIELQGMVYGSRIAEARPFPGVVEFFHACSEREVRVSIISHKTRFPHKGPRVNLHDAAMNWLEAHGISLPGRVFFELTKAMKLNRIARCHCDWFIDDLPELLTDPDFPAEVDRVLFDPAGQHPKAAAPKLVHLRSWDAISRMLLPVVTQRRAG